MYADKYPSTLKDVPTEEHWIILEESSYTEPAYDRHSSPSQSSYLKMEVYLTKEKLMATIQERHESKFSSYPRAFKVLHVQPMQVNLQLTVSIK